MEDGVLNQFHITTEVLREDIKQGAEGVIKLNEKFDKEISQFRKEVDYSNEELKAIFNEIASPTNMKIISPNPFLSPLRLCHNEGNAMFVILNEVKNLIKSIG